MSGFFLGYYFCSNKDKEGIEKIETNINTLVDGPIKPMMQPNAAVPELRDIDRPTIFRIAADPMVGFIVAHPTQENDLSGVCGQWDDFFVEFDDIVLGRACIAVGFGLPESALAMLPGARKNILKFSVHGNEGVRDGWGWRDDRSHYAFQEVDSGWLLKELPLIEMRSFRAELLRKYYRDQRSIISVETEQFGKDLSKILYSNLVPANNQEQINKVEEDLTNLSKGFGMLTANYRIIKEGYIRLHDLLHALEGAMDNVDSSNEDFVKAFLDPFEQEVAHLKELAGEIAENREGYQAGLEVVRGKLDVLMSRESLNLQQKVMEVMEVSNKMQQQSLTFQVAASLIEFVIVAYYGLSLWKYLNEAGFHALPGWASALLILAFSGDVTYLTHLIAERVQGETGLRGKTVAALALLCLVLGIMAGAAGFAHH